MEQRLFSKLHQSFPSYDGENIPGFGQMSFPECWKFCPRLWSTSSQMKPRSLITHVISSLLKCHYPSVKPSVVLQVLSRVYPSEYRVVTEWKPSENRVLINQVIECIIHSVSVQKLLRKVPGSCVGCHQDLWLRSCSWVVCGHKPSSIYALCSHNPVFARCPK